MIFGQRPGFPGASTNPAAPSTGLTDSLPPSALAAVVSQASGNPNAGLAVVQEAQAQAWQAYNDQYSQYNQWNQVRQGRSEIAASCLSLDMLLLNNNLNFATPNLDPCYFFLPTQGGYGREPITNPFTAEGQQHQEKQREAAAAAGSSGSGFGSGSGSSSAPAPSSKPAQTSAPAPPPAPAKKSAATVPDRSGPEWRWYTPSVLEGDDLEMAGEKGERIHDGWTYDAVVDSPFLKLF